MSDATIDGLTPGELATVVELQRVELDRLLAEMRRLNDRLDQMLRLQEREQVLRQQMQAALDKLAEQKTIGQSAGGGHAGPLPQLTERLDRSERKYNALQQAVVELVNLIERKERERAQAALDIGAFPTGGPVV